MIISPRRPVTIRLRHDAWDLDLLLNASGLLDDGPDEAGIEMPCYVAVEAATKKLACMSLFIAGWKRRKCIKEGGMNENVSECDGFLMYKVMLSENKLDDTHSYASRLSWFDCTTM